jgi:hypothetical protein
MQSRFKSHAARPAGRQVTEGQSDTSDNPRFAPARVRACRCQLHQLPMLLTRSNRTSSRRSHVPANTRKPSNLSTSREGKSYRHRARNNDSAVSALRGHASKEAAAHPSGRGDRDRLHRAARRLRLRQIGLVQCRRLSPAHQVHRVDHARDDDSFGAAPGGRDRGAGAAAVARQQWVAGMEPSPPYLLDSTSKWTPSQLFWIAKNGIKMTGMPSWRDSLSDGQIWDVVAFLEAMRQLPPQTYVEWRSRRMCTGFKGPWSAPEPPSTRPRAPGRPTGATGGSAPSSRGAARP